MGGGVRVESAVKLRLAAVRASVLGGNNVGGSWGVGVWFSSGY